MFFDDFLDDFMLVVEFLLKWSDAIGDFVYVENILDRELLKFDFTNDFFFGFSFSYYKGFMFYIYCLYF